MNVKLRKENLAMLQPLLGKLVQMRSESLDLAKERRSACRQREQATIEVHRDGEPAFATAPLIEYTQFGARLVLRNASAGQSVDFIISTPSRTVSGQGRVAWTSPLANGRAVVGLELVKTTSVLRSGSL